MVNANNQDPFVDMDSEYQYVEFDDEDPPATSSNKNTWVHEFSGDPQSERLKKEIEDILKEAEDAKRVAEMQNLLKQTEAARLQESVESNKFQGQQSVTTAATNDASANNGTNDGKNNVPNDGKDDRTVLDAAKDEMKDEVKSAPNEEKESKWRKMMSFEPLMVVANVAKEVLFAVSMFSVASYLTLQFLDMQ
jgi:hypothetical protein